MIDKETKITATAKAAHERLALALALAVYQTRKDLGQPAPERTVK